MNTETMGWRALALALVLVVWTLPAWAQEEATVGDDPPDEEVAGPPPGQPEEGEEGSASDDFAVYEEIEVREREDSLVGIAESASEGSTGAEDLARRPIQRAGELVETVPGVIATQHSGGGKANQYYLRGFNLDHGTDFSLWVAGTPVNMPSHGHGQGYADFNFVIPEMIERMRYRKGPYFADVGDFSAAGSAEVDLLRALPGSLVEVTGGQYGYERLLAADSTAVGGGDLLGAVELSHSDGPWERGDDYQRVNALVRFSRGDARSGFSLTGMGYDGDWLSTDQVPRRAVESGAIDRYGLIDPGPRGESHRYSLSGEAHRGTERSYTEVSAYALAYELDLFSNFTYFLDNPVRGDQFEQVDDRWATGLDASRRWSLHGPGSSQRPIELAVGFQGRYDDIENGLFRTRDLQRFETARSDTIDQLSLGPYGEVGVRWTDWLRTEVGLRADYYYADVEGDLSANSGTADDFLLSPKLSAVLGPWKRTELYLNVGYGFHSNDARGATLRVDPTTGASAARVDPLARARGADVGLRTTAIDGLQSTVTLFGLELDSELVFVGDAGGTEASRPSRRVGVEWTNFYRVTRAVVVDLDVAWAEARFTDDDPAGDHIPGAVETVAAAGVSFEGARPWSAGARLRWFSGYPLIEDDSVRSGATALINGRVGYRFGGGFRLVLEGFNLLDRDDADVAYFYPSRLPGEPEGGVEDIHFHPVERPSARLSLIWGR